MTRVSVIMPMRNAEPYVADALASVLQEQQIEIEVVVVDDGSTDRSRERVLAVADTRIRLVNGPQQGISECLNAGFSVARGDILMRCDADDLFPSGRIAAQVTWLDAHPQHGAVCGGFSTMDQRGRAVSAMGIEHGAPLVEISGELKQGLTRTSLCTFAIRRVIVGRVGVFRRYFETAEDIDYLLRLGEATMVAFIPINTYHYRLHQTSVTHSQAHSRRAFFDAVARDFQKQRLSAGQDALQRGCAPQPPNAAAREAGSSANAHVQGMLVGEAWRAADRGAHGQALRLVLRAIAQRPWAMNTWRSLAVLTLRGASRLVRRGS